MFFSYIYFPSMLTVAFNGNVLVDTSTNRKHTKMLHFSWIQRSRNYGNIETCENFRVEMLRIFTKTENRMFFLFFFKQGIEVLACMPKPNGGETYTS